MPTAPKIRSPKFLDQSSAKRSFSCSAVPGKDLSNRIGLASGLGGFNDANSRARFRRSGTSRENRMDGRTKRRVQTKGFCDHEGRYEIVLPDSGAKDSPTVMVTKGTP